MAFEAAKDSKCVSLNVGCILAKDGRIISTGINGTPRGYHNCNEVFSERCAEHTAWSIKYEIHAEMNAMLQSHTNVKGSYAYVTHSPCFNCIKHLIGAGIEKIYFHTKYYNMSDSDFEEIKEYCKHSLVELIQVNDDGTEVIYS